MKVIYLLAMLLCGTLTSCDLYDRIEVEEIHPPQIENDNIIIPDWDKKEEQV
ncbi:MAG: hypothetical protein SNG27_07300 [Rikenellaceae bacterium]